MKNLILATALTAAGFFAVEATADEPVDCQQIEMLAAKIMEARQNNASMSTLMGIGDHAAIQALVMMAYDEPAYTTAGYKRTAVAEFANEVARLCYQAD